MDGVPTMKSPALLACVLAGGSAALAQNVTDPHITTWLTARSAQYARIYETSSAKTSGTTVTTWPSSGLTNGGGGQSTNAYADVQRVAYSNNYVYIYTTGLASYTMGNWLNPQGGVFQFWPTNRAAIHRIPRNPTIPTTKSKANGVGGVWVNGVYLWENGDAQSYTTSTGTVSFNGQGVWNRLAGVAEAFNFDPANGHQPSSGAYHTHINPIGLRYQLGDNVTYNATTKTYSEATTPTKHSPILGWALDGLPVYGPYGYSSPMDPNSGIRRMTSGFQKRDGTNGSTNLSSTGRTTLPVWAASVQGVSTTLPSTECGPNVNTTYPLGTFAEDYDYMGDLGKTQGVDFDLNRQNVRYCVTPEYPNGTYAYFVSIDASGNTAFPDVINQEFYGSTTGGQGTVTSINESVTEYSDAGPAAAITVTAAASGSGVGLSWNSAEGATYKVESSPDNATWTTVSSAVTSAGLTTTYTAAASATFFRVTLTAIATYDTGGTYGTPVGKSGTVQYGTITVAPSITTQPTSVTVTAGASASFTVAASGTAPLTYQWQKGGNAISGATTTTYTIAATQSSDAGTYTCVVSNSAGSATSNNATLTVNTPVAPSIATQPASVTVTAGGSASFTVAATGTAPLSYQWSKGGATISGATASTYTIATTQASDAGSYTCTISNSVGSVVTNAATVTVTNPVTAPAITTQPTSASVLVGANASFTVAASGSTPLNYQWYKGVSTIAGATAATYTITNVQLANAGTYLCVVSNSAGSATSNGATLTVTAPAVAPVVTQQPTSASATTGGSATFTVVASGTAPLTYQWAKGGATISGATSATLTLTNVQLSDAGNYSCTVTNSAGSAVSSVAALTVSAAAVAPTIAASPLSATVTAGSAVSFSVVANGTAPLAYQWLKGSAAIAGATSATYTIASAQSGDAGNYACTVSNSVGSVTSSTAALTVSTAAVVPSVTQQPASATVTAGAAISFSVTASGTAPLTYQWYKGVAAISGATTATYSIAAAQTADAGSYTCVVSNSVGSDTSAAATLVVNAGSSGGSGGGTGGSGGSTGPLPARLVNVSVRTQVGGAAGTPAVGFVLSGSGTGKRLIVRAVGPTLGSFGVTGILLDPQLQLWSGNTMLASNDNWQSSDATAFSSVGAFALQSGSADAALVTTLAAGAYTTPVVGANGSTGIVLVECYDGSSTDTSVKLVNASARAAVGVGDNVLIPAFVIEGEGTIRLLIRAVGPELLAYGVRDALVDPQLTVYQGKSVVAANDNWSDDPNAAQVATVASSVGAFPLPSGSKDAAVLVTLSAGAYSVVASGVGGTTGTGLVEFYVVP